MNPIVVGSSQRDPINGSIQTVSGNLIRRNDIAVR